MHHKLSEARLLSAMYDLSRKLPNGLRFRIIENNEISGKSQN